MDTTVRPQKSANKIFEDMWCVIPMFFISCMKLQHTSHTDTYTENHGERIITNFQW